MVFLWRILVRINSSFTIMGDVVSYFHICYLYSNILLVVKNTFTAFHNSTHRGGTQRQSLSNFYPLITIISDCNPCKNRTCSIWGQTLIIIFRNWGRCYIVKLCQIFAYNFRATHLKWNRL